MNTQAVAPKAQQSRAASDRNVSTLNSTDALSMIEHGSELTMGISTPVGTTFRCKTSFIGTHSDNLVLVELPKVSEDDLNFFFQSGFWVTVRAISPRGEGAIVHFRSQIQHATKSPVPLLTLSIPQTMQVTQLRKEPRFEVNLTARALSNSHKLDCEIRDLSKGGCRFVTPPLSRPFQVGDEVSLNVQITTAKGIHFEPLFGRVCNLQRSLHYARYGMEFTDHGKNNAKLLLGHLKFNGTKLTLR
ncbi:flagellar brake protein [Vibrio sp. RE86]|uniref:flagellar brake protein n=1 Tax=Vibrio sp. RE86 TaxID=2607605 RepID=UPI0014932A7A|nr:flagellar brake protein [Vibrio sp. RE86]NOH78241.1 flagellar brake protein [Vibrio sp. RE86]